MSNYSPIVAALLSFILSHFLILNKSANKLQDVPNERSLHSIPVPRIGGIGLIFGVLSGWSLMYSALEWWLVMPVLLLFGISLLDDINGLSVRQRFLVHLIAAVILVMGSGFYSEQGTFLAMAVLLFSVWMINLYNFMDGSNGLAGGMTLLGFGFYGIAAWLTNNTSLALLNFCIAAAAGSFLYFNFHPAKIFMGDSGSIPLGFLSVAMGLWGWQQGTWNVWFPFLVFSPFVIDASITLVKRIIRGANISEAHREHYYQRLVQIGWGHRNVALFEYVLMLIVGISALWVRTDDCPWLMLLMCGSVYACLMLALDMHWKNFKRGANA